MARALAAAEGGYEDDDVGVTEVIATPAPATARGRKKQKANAGAAPAVPTTTATAERASVTPFAREVDRVSPILRLKLPEAHQLVSASTYRVLQWGLTGHRDVLRVCAGTLHGLAQDASLTGAELVPLETDQVKASRDEWNELPFVVRQVPPRAGHVYVTHEANDQIKVGSELYHRIFIEEGTPPKQVPLAVHEERVAAAKEAEKANKADRKKYGETAPLGVKLSVVKTIRNGDCFFDAICKAYRLGVGHPPVHRAKDMWQTAAAFHSGGAQPTAADGAGGDGGAASSDAASVGATVDASGASDAAAVDAVDVSAAEWLCGDEPLSPNTGLTVRELRGVVGAHYPEVAWLIGQSAGGESFEFIDSECLERTRKNVAALADDALDRAYWADESAIALVQRYLGVRLLIFNPSAAAGNRCSCAGGRVDGVDGMPRRYILLCHSNRSTKLQHYELYSKGGSGDGAMAVFDEESLPPGVKCAFAAVCPDATPAWRTAKEPDVETV